LNFVSANLGTEASAAEASAVATGEAFVPAYQSTVMVSGTCTLEPVAL